MSEEKSLELRVSVDVGYGRHSVAMGLSSGEVLEEFEIDHRIEGFEEFFSRIEKQRKKKNCAVAVAMEGCNGYALPLDSMVRVTTRYRCGAVCARSVSVMVLSL